MPTMHMTCVDLWAAQAPRDIPGSETYTDWPHEQTYRGFVKFVDEVFPGRVRVLRMSTVEAAPLVEDHSLDFVFVDADHTYQGALDDIRQWTPKIRAGGLLAGHDYNWPTVRRAVKDTGKHAVTGDNVWLRFIP